VRAPREMQTFVPDHAARLEDKAAHGHGKGHGHGS
jgi:hypothetical protein